MALQIKTFTMFVFSMLFIQHVQTTRTVMIFTDKPDNAYTTQQINILKADPNGTKTRDIIYKVVTNTPANIPVYKQYGIPNSNFTVLLIGKDKGEKLRSHQPVTTTKLYDLIDNMPMRREEMRYNLTHKQK